MAIIIPPWLNQQGADPASAFVSAFRAGASVALEKAQLQRQSENAAMAAAIRQQENEQQARREDQKIAIESAEKKAQIGLEQQKLDLAQQMAVQTARAAAMSFQVQETYRRRVAAGEDPQKVLLELGPSMGIKSGLSSLAKAPTELFQPGPPQDVLDASGRPTGYQALQTSRAAVTYRKTGGDVKQAKNPYLADLEKRLFKAKADLVADPKNKAAAQAIPRLEAELVKLEKPAAGQPFPEGALIRNKKDGKLYKVVNGKPELAE